MQRKYNLEEKIDFTGCVVYLITNLTNSKVYVGSAVNMKKRIERHYRELRKGYHINKHFYNAWNKNPHSFEVTVLEYVDYTDKKDLTYLHEREQYWINYYDALNPNKGYNIKGNFDFNFLDEEAIIKRTESSKKTFKAVMTFDKDTGEFIEEFESVSEAARVLGTSSSNISGVCNGKHAYVKNRTCCYKNEYDPEKSYIAKKPNLKRSEETKLKMKKAITSWKGKKIYVYENNKLFKIFDSIAECERYFEFKKDTLRYKIKKGISYNGYTFSYENYENKN